MRAATPPTAAARERLGRGRDAPGSSRLERATRRARGAGARSASYLGAGIGSFVEPVRRRVVVIGGGFGVAAFDLLLPAARASLRAGGARAGGREVPIVRAELGDEAGLVGAGLIAFEALDAEPMPLAVCATPIGNLDDVTLRVLRELREADVVLGEDTRATRGLLDRHGIAARLLSYHEHNEAKRTAELLPRLAGGRADRARLRRGPAGRQRPGRAAGRGGARGRRAGDGAAGASAVETALVACGLAGERYQFLGYLPRGEAALAALGRSSAPGRIRRSPSSRRSACRRRCARSPRRSPDAPVAVCRELTKRFEEVARGTAAALAERSRSRRRARSRSCSGRPGRRRRRRRGRGARSGRRARRRRASPRPAAPSSSSR